MADNSIINALKGVDPADAMPFGAANTPEGSPTMFGNMLSGLMGMPKHLIDAAKTYDPQDPHGSIDRLIPASTETAMSLAGVGAPAAEVGAAGIFGGKLAKTADMKALIEANDMFKGSKPMSQIYGDTGWFKSPTDMKWRFEIPDDRSRMIGHGLDYSKEGNFVRGPAGVILDHPELYKAYPQLAKDDMYNSVFHNAPNGVGRGSYDPVNGVAEIEAGNLDNARNVALHEMQHGVQTLENFAPGGNPRRIEYLQRYAQSKLPLNELKSDPNDVYARLGGEVESRNVQTRMDMTPAHRRLVSPWETQDTRYSDQLAMDPRTELIRALRNSR